MAAFFLCCGVSRWEGSRRRRPRRSSLWLLTVLLLFPLGGVWVCVRLHANRLFPRNLHGGLSRSAHELPLLAVDSTLVRASSVAPWLVISGLELCSAAGLSEARLAWRLCSGGVLCCTLARFGPLWLKCSAFLSVWSCGLTRYHRVVV